MSKKSTNRILSACTALFCLTILLITTTHAQRRDYLTIQEVELVRDAQQIDLRIDVLTKAIDRRFLVLKNDNTQTKQIEKDSSKWGELPVGSRMDLLLDIEKILQKAVDDIDDIAAHKRMDSKYFPKAMFKLTGSCQNYIPQFKNFYDSAANEKEKGAVLGSMELCDQIIEASAKVPKEPTKEEIKAEKKKKKN